MNYENFMMTSVKATSRTGKKIKIVEPTKINDFLNKLKDDETIDLEVRTIIAVGISTGGRIEEILSMKASDVTNDYIAVKVLKKRIEATREAKLHPVAVELLARLNKTGDQKFFSLDRKQSWYQLKKHFGICNHSLRHTHISMLVEMGVHQLKIVKIMNLSNVTVVSAYSHCNVKKELDDIFKKVS